MIEGNQMTITEPMTMITDYLLTIVSGVAAWRLLRSSRHGDRALRFWAGALAFTGVAALAGGTFHGLGMAMPQVVAVACWKTTMFAIGIATFCFGSAVILSVLPERAHLLVFRIFLLTLVAYLVIVWRNDAFRYAIYYYVPTMVGVLVIVVYLWLRRRRPGSMWIVAGIVLSFLGALIQMGGRGFHANFNHNDIYHVVQMAGIYCFYRGGTFFRARSGATP